MFTLPLFRYSGTLLPLQKSDSHFISISLSTCHTQAPSSSSLTYAPLFDLTFLIRQHSQHLKRSRIREQVCSSFSALPVSSQRKVVVPYSLLSHPHCPLLDSPDTHCFVILMFTFNFSHLSAVFSLPHSLI